jgi:4'-phosphopantetheinyl transferase
LQAIPEIQHWHPLANPPTLRPGGLHLWRIRTGNDGMPLEDLRSLLSRRESERAGRLRHSHHRARYVRAQAGLRSILSSYINIIPQAIVFTYGSAGKPLLESTVSDLEFNLTTSGDLALAAISYGQPVGVDCEQVRERNDVVAIARKMFTPGEATQIAGLAQQERLLQFHLSWTALEAGVKADGRGLFRHKDPLAQGELEFGHCVPEPGYIAAVARKDLPALEEWVTLELTRG